MPQNKEAISSSFIKQRQRDIGRIVRSLINSDEISINSLRGNGIDIGCWYGTSTSVLERYGGYVTAIEQATIPTREGINFGLIDPNRLIVGEATEVLKRWQNHVDFITFFGATSAVNFEVLLDNATRLLNSGGFLLLTTIPELEGDIDRLVTSSGYKFSPASAYVWDKVGFLYHPK